MDRHAIIPMFSSVWWIGLIASVIVIILLLNFAKRLSPEAEIKFRWLIAGTVIAREIAWHFFLLTHGEWLISESLPLHLCGISRLLGIVVLLRPRQLLFEYLILLGMAGAIQSFVTPEMTHGSSFIFILDFYYSHSVIIFTAMYAFFVMKMKLDKWSWLRVFVFGHILLTAVGIINYWIGGNYIYLCERPLAENPLIVGEWPYYLISFQVAALFHIVLFSLIFISLQKRSTISN